MLLPLRLLLFGGEAVVRVPGFGVRVYPLTATTMYVEPEASTRCTVPNSSSTAVELETKL
jgi:hypothetical protein